MAAGSVRGRMASHQAWRRVKCDEVAVVIVSSENDQFSMVNGQLSMLNRQCSIVNAEARLRT
jgi:hypothetical protein